MTEQYWCLPISRNPDSSLDYYLGLNSVNQLVVIPHSQDPLIPQDYATWPYQLLFTNADLRDVVKGHPMYKDLIINLKEEVKSEKYKGPYDEENKLKDEIKALKARVNKLSQEIHKNQKDYPDYLCYDFKHETRGEINMTEPTGTLKLLINGEPWIIKHVKKACLKT